MIRTLSAASLVCVLSAALIGQSADSKPTFESADVHTVAVGRIGTNMSGGALRGGRYDVRSARSGAAAEENAGEEKWRSEATTCVMPIPQLAITRSPNHEITRLTDGM